MTLDGARVPGSLGSSAGVEPPVGEVVYPFTLGFSLFLAQSGPQGSFLDGSAPFRAWSNLCKVPQPVKVDSDLESVLFELLHASSPLHKNSKSVFQGWEILWQLCQFYLENEKGGDKILCEVQRNEANLTDVYLTCMFAHWAEARGHVLVDHVLTSRKRLPSLWGKLLSHFRLHIFFFLVSISADNPLQRDTWGTKRKQEGPTLV